MSKIKGKGNKPEKLLKRDVVFIKNKLVIFVDDSYGHLTGKTARKPPSPTVTSELSKIGSNI